MRREPNVQKLKKALLRSNTRLLLSAVMLFQCAAMLLLAFKSGTIDVQPLVMAVAIPLVTGFTAMFLTKLWPADRAIVILSMLLCSVGLITLQAIARASITPRTQAWYALIGVFAMALGTALIRGLYRFRRYTPVFMVLCALALLTPFVLGSWYEGARNWIKIAGISAQPSEFIKPALIVVLAFSFSNKPRFVKCLIPIAFAAALCAILLAERDLGALLLYFLTTVAMYYVATSNAMITLAGLGMGAGASVAAYQLFPLVQRRIAMWKDPWSDPLVYGHQIIQALIAIGSGGLFGMGLGLGMPRNIPLYHSDFIFAAMTEEFGWVFSVCVLAVYVLIILRGLVIAANARKSFHSLVAFGVVVMLGFQTMLIVGGNTKLLPLTGVTLPFISAGGSSLVSTFFSIGMLLGISSMNAEDEARDIEQLELREDALL